MSRALTPILAALGLTTLVGAVVLLVFKVVRYRIRRFAEFRRAVYMGVLSEVATRAGYPIEMLRRWVSDRVFVETLIEYLRSLRGPERENLLRVARETDVIAGRVRVLARSHSKRRRVAAAEALAELGDASAVDPLIDALRDREATVRWNAAGALARIGEARAVPLIMEALAAEQPWGADRLMDVLVEFGAAAVPYLSRYLLLATPNIEGTSLHAVRICRALGLIGDPGAEQALVMALETEDDELRTRAAAALGTAGTPRCIPAVVRALRDRAWEVRSQAAISLGQLQQPQALEPLLEAMRDPSWWVRQNAADAVGRLPGGDAALIRMLNHPDQYASHSAVERLMASGRARQAAERVKAGDPQEGDEKLVHAFRSRGRSKYLDAAPGQALQWEQVAG